MNRNRKSSQELIKSPNRPVYSVLGKIRICLKKPVTFIQFFIPPRKLFSEAIATVSKGRTEVERANSNVLATTHTVAASNQDMQT